MRRAQQGDRQAFALLYERYNAAVLSYLYRMLGSVEDVEAIGQEVFLRAYRFAASYRFPQKFSHGFLPSPATWRSTRRGAKSAVRYGM